MAKTGGGHGAFTLVDVVPDVGEQEFIAEIGVARLRFEGNAQSEVSGRFALQKCANSSSFTTPAALLIAMVQIGSFCDNRSLAMLTKVESRMVATSRFRRAIDSGVPGRSQPLQRRRGRSSHLSVNASPGRGFLKRVVRPDGG